MYKPTAKSYFSGAGLSDLGLTQAGVNIIQSLEIDKNCIETLRLNFTHDVDTRDITKVTVYDQPKSDIVWGTYPCNKYSAISDIHQTRTGDDLYLHFFRHLALERPEVYALENVPGMRKFPVVMEAMTRLPGYYVQTFCPLDADIWLPQRRARLIIIGTKKPFHISAPAKTKQPKLKDILEKSPDVKIPQYLINRLKGDYRDKPIISDPEAGDLAPTCIAHYAKDLGTRLVKDSGHPMGVRPYSKKEWARLQGVPDWYKFAAADTYDPYRQIGNGVPVDMARWVGEQLVRYFN